MIKYNDHNVKKVPEPIEYEVFRVAKYLSYKITLFICNKTDLKQQKVEYFQCRFKSTNALPVANIITQKWTSLCIVGITLMPPESHDTGGKWKWRRNFQRNFSTKKSPKLCSLVPRQVRRSEIHIGRGAETRYEQSGRKWGSGVCRVEISTWWRHLDCWKMCLIFEYLIMTEAK